MYLTQHDQPKIKKFIYFVLFFIVNLLWLIAYSINIMYAN